MITLTLVAAFLAVLVIGAVSFTVVGLRRRRRARDSASGSERGQKN
jgi:hypothetical protein